MGHSGASGTEPVKAVTAPMTQRTCSVEGCDGDATVRGWCGKHYARWYKHGDPEVVRKPMAPRPRKYTVCTIEGCSKPHDAKGYCNLHYTRWLRHGDPLIVKREKNRNGVRPCSEDGCDAISQTGGMCGRHYGRWLHSQRGPCSVEGCHTTWLADGLCGKHYNRKRSHGTTDDPEPTPLRGSCSVDGCDGPVKARGWCGMHLRRWYTFGTTDLPNRLRERRCRFCKRKLAADQFTVAAPACIDCLPLHRAELKRITLPRTKEIRAREAELRAVQGDRCAICGIAEEDAPKGRLHTDHDHGERGAIGIRGLLCSNCNSGLGHFKDSPALLTAAIHYLDTAGPTGQLPLFAV